jgi:3-oxoacyl-[acyl-carrier-protein] synthase-3
MHAGIKLMTSTWELATKTLDNISDDRINIYVPHQISSHNTTAFVKSMGLTASKFKLTYPTFGNTGPVGLPTALAMADEEGQLQAGDHVCMLGIGSGLNATLMSVTW